MTRPLRTSHLYTWPSSLLFCFHNQGALIWQDLTRTLTAPAALNALEKDERGKLLVKKHGEHQYHWGCPITWTPDLIDAITRIPFFGPTRVGIDNIMRLGYFGHEETIALNVLQTLTTRLNRYSPVQFPHPNAVSL